MEDLWGRMQYVYVYLWCVRVCVCFCVCTCVRPLHSPNNFPGPPGPPLQAKSMPLTSPTNPIWGTLKLVGMYVYTHMLPKLLGMMGPTGSGVADPHPSGKAARAAHAQAANRGPARGNAAAPRGANRAAPTRVRIAGRLRCIAAPEEAT